MGKDLQKRLGHFSGLGGIFLNTAGLLQKQSTTDHTNAGLLLRAAKATHRVNPFFTPGEISRSLEALGGMLSREKLERWLANYPELDKKRRVLTVGVVMAGNVPLVGFHDMLSVLMAGHRLIIRTSSQDPYLPAAVARILSGMDPYYENNICFGESLHKAEAIIATGSDNTSRYFSWQYGHLPHIIRRNRTSAAIVTNDDSMAELSSLGGDIFAYYGKGCRNVSFLLLPSGFDISCLPGAWEDFRYVSANSAYHNNLRYQRAYYTAAGDSYIDKGFFLLREDPLPVSPLGVLHYRCYDHPDEAASILQHHGEALQCVAGPQRLKKQFPGLIPFGLSQRPEVWDYADGVDTIAFLLDQDG